MTSYIRPVLRYLERHAADVYYTLDFRIVQALLGSYPLLSRRTFYEVHSFPKSDF